MRWLSSGALWSIPLLVLACSEPQRSFSVVSPQKARSLLRQGELSVVDTASTDAPVSGGVLVIASTAAAGYRKAAALSRSGSHPTYVCVPENADERSSLYALARQTEEIALEKHP